MYNIYRENYFHLVVGPIMSSKTTTLIGLIERERYAKREVGVFKPKIDNRYSEEAIVTHNGLSVPSFVVEQPSEIYQTSIEKGFQTVVIDEVQFFNKNIVKIVEKLIKSGKRVIAAGLDMDFKNEPFGSVPELLARAEIVTKLTGICSVCGAAATRSQRLINGEPAQISSAVVQVGGKELYQPRCSVCHELSDD